MLPYQKLINGIKKILNPRAYLATDKPVQAEASLPPESSIQRHVATRVPRPEHSVSRKAISRAALKVLYQLNSSGYQAFLVGGSVRDMLLGLKPKDFDVVTNARPEEVKKLFPNCRLIGRRFVLAHVYFGREIVEVATFRANHNNGKGGVMREGRIIQDNVYGTIDEDAWRRDFTINALYYDISDYALLDYANGLEDIKKGVIRLLGDPMLRYQEDPVRMLRAARFAAKLQFEIEVNTAAPIMEMGSLMATVPSARLYDEVLKLFSAGHAKASFEQLRRHDLFRHLFAETHACFDNEVALRFVELALQSTDERIISDKPITPAFLYACLLWPPIAQRMPFYLEQGMPEQEALLNSAQEVTTAQGKQVTIPRRISTGMQEIWLLQPRLTRRKSTKRQRQSLYHHARFRAGFDFLVLRAEAGEADTQESVDWWHRFQAEHQAPHHHKESVVIDDDQHEEDMETSEIDVAHAHSDVELTEDNIPKRRPPRRRRRKPKPTTTP